MQRLHHQWPGAPPSLWKLPLALPQRHHSCCTVAISSLRSFQYLAASWCRQSAMSSQSCLSMGSRDKSSTWWFLCNWLICVPHKSSLIWGKEQTGSCLQAVELLFLIIKWLLAYQHPLTMCWFAKQKEQCEMCRKGFCGNSMNKGNWGSLSVKNRDTGHLALGTWFKKQKSGSF